MNIKELNDAMMSYHVSINSWRNTIVAKGRKTYNIGGGVTIHMLYPYDVLNSTIDTDRIRFFIYLIRMKIRHQYGQNRKNYKPV